MRKVMRLFGLVLALAAVSAAMLVCAGCTVEDDGESERYLRIHIRANDNGRQSQDVKYKVKEALVEYLTPVLAGCADKASAQAAVRGMTGDIERVCAEVLSAHGFGYGARAELSREFFPARSYGDTVLPEGEYDALIVALGEGGGDNWWCMVYPPLCFTGGESNGTNTVVYKSKIQEIIENFKNKYFS